MGMAAFSLCRCNRWRINPLSHVCNYFPASVGKVWQMVTTNCQQCSRGARIVFVLQQQPIQQIIHGLNWETFEIHRKLHLMTRV